MRTGGARSDRFAASPIGTVLEEICLGWLLDVLKLPPASGGAFVTNATVANFTALAVARHVVLTRVGWDVEAEGLFGAPLITVVVGDEVHASLIKALGMLGLGRSCVVRTWYKASRAPISGPPMPTSG